MRIRLVMNRNLSFCEDFDIYAFAGRNDNVDSIRRRAILEQFSNQRSIEGKRENGWIPIAVRKWVYSCKASACPSTRTIAVVVLVIMTPTLHQSGSLGLELEVGQPAFPNFSRIHSINIRVHGARRTLTIRSRRISTLRPKALCGSLPE